MAEVDVDRIAALLAEVVEAELMPRFGRLGAGEVREKTGPRDLVTAADLAVEAVLGRRLPDFLPGAAVLGEEAAADEPALLGLVGGEAPVFALDPLDGTANFVAGRPEFAVMLALIVGTEVRAGWIHQPAAGRTAVAVAGEGAWLRAPGRPDRRLAVAAPVASAEMIGVIKVRYLDEPLKSRVRARRRRLGARRDYACAGHEYIEAADGRLHALLYGRLFPWDHAPGWLIHRQAGGFSAHFDGTAYDPRVVWGGMMMAPDAAGWKALHALLIAE